MLTMFSGVYLTGLLVVDKVLKEEDIQPLLASCTETMDDNILSMDSFLGKSSHSIKIITPTICDGNAYCVTFIWNKVKVRVSKIRSFIAKRLKAN